MKQNKQIKEHESEYYHIPKLKGNPWCILLTFIFGMLSYFNFKLIISIFKFVDLANPFGDLFEESIKGVHQLIVIYPILFEYVFIILTLIFLALVLFSSASSCLCKLMYSSKYFDFKSLNEET